MDLFPTEAEYKGGRLFSLDLLRGLDMFYLAVVTPALVHLFRALGVDSCWTRFFCSHPWEGFTLYDLIMPLFIFMCGAAIPFALGRRIEHGRPKPGFWRHVWGRFILLWIMGMLVQGNLASLDFHQISPYNNTLQTIAVGYVVAAYVMTIRKWCIRIAIPVVLTVVYGLVVHFGGDYSVSGNVTQFVELKVLHALLPADNVEIGRIVNHGYTWFLPSLMFPVITLSGAFSVEILRHVDESQWRRVLYLSGMGVVLLLIGWGLSRIGVRVVKHIFTVSFALQAIGWSELLLAIIYIITDIWRLRRGFGVLLLFGQYALTAYLCEALFRDACYAVADRLDVGLVRFFSSDWQDFVRALGYGGVVIFVVAVRRKLGLMSRK